MNNNRIEILIVDNQVWNAYYIKGDFSLVNGILVDSIDDTRVDWFDIRKGEKIISSVNKRYVSEVIWDACTYLTESRRYE